MELPGVPACFSCSGSAQDVSIACTECNQLCCRACFGLMKEEADSDDDVDSDRSELARTKRVKLVWVCSRCRRQGTVVKDDTKEHLLEHASSKQEPMTDESLANVEQTRHNEPSTFRWELEPKQNRCSLHDQEYTLYCLTCDELVCGSCFPIGKSHMRHQIDHIEAVYRERLTKTEQKLEQIGEKVKDLQKNIVLDRKNLELLQEVEQSICDDIDLLCAEAKQSVAKMTDGRKQTLQIRLDFPATVEKLNESLQEMTRQLPQAEFLRQQLMIEKQCDEMLGNSVPRYFTFERFEDIGCELVPPYQTCLYLLNLGQTSVVWPQRKIIVCETRWTVDLRRKDHSLFVKVTPGTEKALEFPFKLLVEISHRSNPLRKSFTVQWTSEEFEVEMLSKGQLQAEEFDEKSALIKIGLRPLHALAELGLLKQQISNTKQILHKSTIRKDPTLTDLGSYAQVVAISNQFCISYFKTNLYKPTGDATFQLSTNVTDSIERQWCLRVYPIDRADTNTNLKAYISLREGAPTKCQFFIELMHHSDPNKNIRLISDTKCMFKAINKCCGWPCLINRQRLLSDPEFYPNEMVCFRFGVRPIAD